MVTEKCNEEENFHISEPLSSRNAAAGSAKDSNIGDILWC
jgi:hypothetical protein